MAKPIINEEGLTLVKDIFREELEPLAKRIESLKENYVCISIEQIQNWLDRLNAMLGAVTECQLGTVVEIMEELETLIKK